jgi:hypothetical protein
MICILILVAVVLLIRYIDYRLEVNEPAETISAEEYDQGCSFQGPNAFHL